MGESGVLFVQSLAVLVWTYATAITIVLGERWVENSSGELEGVMKVICTTCTLIVLWFYALPHTLLVVHGYLSGGESIECVKMTKESTQ